MGERGVRTGRRDFDGSRSPKHARRDQNRDDKGNDQRNYAQRDAKPCTGDTTRVVSPPRGAKRCETHGERDGTRQDRDSEKLANKAHVCEECADQADDADGAKDNGGGCGS